MGAGLRSFAPRRQGPRRRDRQCRRERRARAGGAAASGAVCLADDRRPTQHRTGVVAERAAAGHRRRGRGHGSRGVEMSRSSTSTAADCERSPCRPVAVRGLVWFDDSTLLLNAALQRRLAATAPTHLTPSGELNPLTRDVNDYDGISLAGDRQTLVGSRRERQTDLAILDAAGRTVTSGPNITARSPAAINWVATACSTPTGLGRQAVNRNSCSTMPRTRRHRRTVAPRVHQRECPLESGSATAAGRRCS